jgi:hypothetical protein
MYQVRLTTNVKQVIKNKLERAKSTFRIEGDKSLVIYKGERLKPEQFERMFPIEPKQQIIYL